MPINSFRSNVQPAAGSLLAAYRPIVFQPQYNTQLAPFPPVVYCDVYFSGNYYRTLTSTSGLGAGMILGPYWIFDIQTVAQEYLQANLYLLTNAGIIPGFNDFVGVQGNFVSCFCKFRVSTQDVNGFTVPEGSPGVGGYPSNTFNILNAVLQHEDIQDLGQHLTLLKQTPNGNQFIDFLPLTHRLNNDIVCKDDYDKFPIFTKPGAPYGGVGDPFYLLRLVYKDDLGVQHIVNTQFNYPLVQNMIYTIPSSIRLLKTLTWFTLVYPVFTPAVVDWDSITEYYLQLMLSIGAPPQVNFTSITFKTRGCNCCKGRMRVRFLNYIGQWDSANFSEINGILITSSAQWQKALRYPLNKTDSGFKKLNSASNEEFSISTCEYGEEFQEWLKELFDSPQAFIEIESVQGQAATLIPIVIADGKFTTRKNESRYEYVTELTFKMANENIRQRN
ncbi:MAG: hypothetical protein WC756_17730 [Taibaiella sp.]|jgi:hypothetical protein